MKLFYFVLLMIFLVSCSSKSGYQLVWSDEFDYAGLPDSSKWSYDVEGNAWQWGNNELQHYTANRLENAVVKDGQLHIIAHKEDGFNRSYTSARLVTKGKGDWLYGRIEVRAKVASGKGTWPAIWMLPSDWEYGGWPDSGEIDIMEYVGYAPDSLFFTVHTGAYNHVKGTHKANGVLVPDAEHDYHVYALEWTASKCLFFLDDEKVFEFKKEERATSAEWPFDKRFHLIVNLAVGGNWGGKHGVDETIFPCEMLVDYVRVYQKDK
ncbi:glycoside hydrolase family 16 protein [Carboxylicivirga marina]|uniref:Glycoside hydrolase family 16 protein n=1 Tax=Carboxylicivirga marina TaxID=2800988 RepID=A0ABS1HMA3_9BACT|nr:glycoside hydrolase family 16 protein [Carboxylicivirga marina]MBK3518802.1 glycoside hydrolase family 16 protein [Carboxylicivirga marina]